MDPARIDTSAPGAMFSDSVVVDPTSQIPEPNEPPVSRRSERPRKKRTVESTLVLRNRQLDSLRAEVRRQYTTFRYRRMASLVVWAALGGAAVLLGAFLARSFDSEEETAAAEDVTGTASPNNPQARATGPGAALPTAPSPSQAAAAPAGPESKAASTEPSTAAAPPARSKATKKQPPSPRALSLDELPTR